MFSMAGVQKRISVAEYDCVVDVGQYVTVFWVILRSLDFAFKKMGRPNIH